MDTIQYDDAMATPGPVPTQRDLEFLHSHIVWDLNLRPHEYTILRREGA